MTLGCPHGGRAPRNLPSIADRLIAAQAQCEAAGERWTAPRARTYELLVGTEHPVRAYDLRARFGPSRRAAKPATVYRALAFLLGLGLVHWVESRNLFVACTRPGRAHNPQILICDCCARAFELNLGAREIAERIAREHGYLLSGWMAEATGLCPTCH